MVNNGKVYVKKVPEIIRIMQFFILFQFVQFFSFRVFLIKKSCQFLCLVLCWLKFFMTKESKYQRRVYIVGKFSKSKIVVAFTSPFKMRLGLPLLKSSHKVFKQQLQELNRAFVNSVKCTWPFPGMSNQSLLA